LLPLNTAPRARFDVEGDCACVFHHIENPLANFWLSDQPLDGFASHDVKIATVSWPMDTRRHVGSRAKGWTNFAIHLRSGYNTAQRLRARRKVAQGYIEFEITEPSESPLRGSFSRFDAI
jgi:hypothetical protein